LVWLDFNTTEGRRVLECDRGASPGETVTKRRAELDLIDLDEIAEDVYSSLSAGTLLIVATQGVYILFR